MVSFFRGDIMEKFHRIVEEICEEERIKFKLLSKGWIYLLEKNNRVGYIAGYKFDLNGHGLGNVLDDKYAFYEVLIEKNYPTILHHIIFRNYQREELENIFELYNQNVVVKSNTGTCGNEVFHLQDLQQLYEITNHLLQKHFSVSICPFYSIKTEYRIIILDNKVKVLYGKKRPIVVGDGVSTIKELLIQFNTRYFKDKNLDSFFDRILPRGEMFEYGWKFNLSQGAVPYRLTDKLLKQKLSEIAVSVGKNLGLSFCSIDIVETEDNELLIMEANSGVMMASFIELYPNGYKIAKEIYRDAIMKMIN